MCRFVTLVFLSLFSSLAFANEQPVVYLDGQVLRWQSLNAQAINVHRGDGSYVTSLAGGESSWAPSTSGSYYLVATTTGPWNEWQRSETVSIDLSANTGPTSGDFVLSQSDTRLIWRAPAYRHRINVHLDDGTYLETLADDSSSWSPTSSGGYYLVASTTGDWSTWERSNTVRFESNSTNPAPVNDFEINVIGNEIVWSGVSGASGYNIHATSINGAGTGSADYVTSLPPGNTSWQPGEPGDYFVVAATGSDWNSWQRSAIISFGAQAQQSFAPDILSRFAGYDADQLALVVDALSHDIIDGAAGSYGQLPSSTFTTYDSQVSDVITELQRERYSCSEGGYLIRERGRMRISQSSYSHWRDIDGYVFDQCRIKSGAGVLATTSYSLSGSLEIDYRSRSGSRFSEGDTAYSWSEFRLEAQTGLLYEVDGGTKITRESSSALGTSSSRTANFSHYRKSQNGAFAQSIANSSYYLRSFYHSLNIYRNQRLGINGSYRGSFSDNDTVNVRTLDEFFQQYGYNQDETIPFKGSAELVFNDGRMAGISANPTGTSFNPDENFIVDINYTAADGLSYLESDILLDGHSINTPNCSHSRPDPQGPVVCDGGQTLIVP